MFVVVVERENIDQVEEEMRKRERRGREKEETRREREREMYITSESSKMNIPIIQRSIKQ